MTIVSEPSSPAAQASAPSPRIKPPATPGPTPPLISDAWLLQRALARRGFFCTVAVGRELPAPEDAALLPPPEFALHLRQPLPIPVLLRVLRALRARNAPPAALLMTERQPEDSYREHLHLNGEHHVLGIRRRFPEQRPRLPRPRCLGIAWKMEGPLRRLTAPGPSCFRTLRAVLTRAAGGVARTTLRLAEAHQGPRGSHFPRPGAAGNYFIGPPARHRPNYDRLKRALDIALALFALAITLPICLAVALIIKAHDRGPIFFTHRREGLHGRPFGCIKFRTMVRHAESLQAQLRRSSQVDGPQFKMANDPRITPIGRFLRKSNIDELPQFLNVLRGDMSVVGPRPSPFDENQLCPGWREARLSVKPGITGLWQISRSRDRGAADFQEWIFYDTQYVERRSLWLDLRILLLTIKELFGKGQ